ncbi:hypothetical protein SAMN02910358_00102 [Lachnospiraceae bacterium XBB1006]|nr:hypothetical protein SAMN02910358_00102 [Lachnospiraceae bacterium XBB1006]
MIVTVFVILCLCIIAMAIELQRFKITNYTVHSKKLKQEYTVLFLSDLHGKTFQGRLLNKVKAANPDYIFLGGDVVTKRKRKELTTMIPFLASLQKIAPVYYGFGNHETTIEEIFCPKEETYRTLFHDYCEQIRQFGIRIVRNESINLNEELMLSVLELPSVYYRKREKVTLSEEELFSFLKPMNTDQFHILMAHHPIFAETYGKLHPDLILSGHTHGGLVRFPWIGSILSTELLWFPKYDGGPYWIKTKTGKIPFYVSKGLGYHSYPIRILNRAEMLKIHLLP